MHKLHPLCGNLVLLCISLVCGQCELVSPFTASTGWFQASVTLMRKMAHILAAKKEKKKSSRFLNGGSSQENFGISNNIVSHLWNRHSSDIQKCAGPITFQIYEAFL